MRERRTSESVYQPTDHELMLAVWEGEIDQLGVLFDRHHRHLYNFFLRQTALPEASEDLVQDVFLRMLRYRHTYRAEGRFVTWMFTIAHNVKVDYYRKKKVPAEPMTTEEAVASHDPNPEELSEKKNEAEILQKALRRLSDEKREVLLLSRFQDLKYEEIAKITGCKVGTVKARIHWAIKELTQKYGELAGAERT